MKPVLEPLLLRLADLPPSWPGVLREVVLREGRAVRGGTGNTIEVKSLVDNSWAKVLLPTGATAFVSAEERDAVLKQILGDAS